MSIIIQGIYKKLVGYYKVVMTDGEGTPLNIIRNHRYTLKIVGVNGPGYTSLDKAKASPPSNSIKVELLTNDDADFPIIIADGQNILASSNNECIVYDSYNSHPTMEPGTIRDVFYSNKFDICRIYYGPSPVNLNDISLALTPTNPDYIGSAELIMHSKLHYRQISVIWHSELSSKYYSHAYLHFNATGGILENNGITPVNRKRAILLKTSVFDGEVKVTKIMIFPHY